MKISELSDEQLLNIIDGQLPVSIDEGDQWYGGSTTILSKDEDGMYQIEWYMSQKLGWDDDDWSFEEEIEQIDSQRLIKYLRNRRFGSFESERIFKQALENMLFDFYDVGCG